MHYIYIFFAINIVHTFSKVPFSSLFELSTSILTIFLFVCKNAECIWIRVIKKERRIKKMEVLLK